MATSPVTPESTAVTTQAPAADNAQTLTPQQESREAVYARLYGNQEGQQLQQVPQGTQAPQEVDYKALVAHQAEQIAALLAATKPAEPPQPAAPKEDWFSLLQQGKRTEAEEAFKSLIAQGAEAKIIEKTMQQALEVTRMERAIEDYNNYVRANNSDMLDVEDLVSLKAEREFAAIQASGKIKTSTDYVNAYKDSVNKAIDSMRTVLRRTRAAAKNEAMTTRRDVLASTVMNPNDIQRREDQGQAANQPANEPDISGESYLEMRRQNSRKLAGM